MSNKESVVFPVESVSIVVIVPLVTFEKPEEASLKLPNFLVASKHAWGINIPRCLLPVTTTECGFHTHLQNSHTLRSDLKACVFVFCRKFDQTLTRGWWPDWTILHSRHPVKGTEWMVSVHRNCCDHSVLRDTRQQFCVTLEKVQCGDNGKAGKPLFGTENGHESWVMNLDSGIWPMETQSSERFHFLQRSTIFCDHVKPSLRPLRMPHSESLFSIIWPANKQYCKVKTCTCQFANGTAAPRMNIPVNGPIAAPTKERDSCTRFPPTSSTTYENAVHKTPCTKTEPKGATKGLKTWFSSNATRDYNILHWPNILVTTVFRASVIWRNWDLSTSSQSTADMEFNEEDTVLEKEKINHTLARSGPRVQT